MPAPDPNAVWIEEGWDGRLTATYEVFLITNRAARKARAVAMLRNVQRGGWLCCWCSEPVPHFRRTDARFCGESCRKKAARSRRHGTGRL
ncbi:MAG TPA: hypothetical protein VM899_08695 [Rubellimicrobium sp.]|jgi:hypothetical protein|nr:hypothetical protein [Rubellimicrobium sp.]